MAISLLAVRLPVPPKLKIYYAGKLGASLYQIPFYPSNPCYHYNHTSFEDQRLPETMGSGSHNTNSTFRFMYREFNCASSISTFRVSSLQLFTNIPYYRLCKKDSNINTPITCIIVYSIISVSREDNSITHNSIGTYNLYNRSIGINCSLRICGRCYTQIFPKRVSKYSQQKTYSSKTNQRWRCTIRNGVHVLCFLHCAHCALR